MTRIAFALTLALATLVGCRQPTHIDITPKQPSLRTRGETVQLVGRVMTNHIEQPRERVQWSVRDPAIATVDEQGRLKGLKGGRTWVTATYGSLKAEMPVEVAFVAALQSDMNDVELSYEEGSPVKPTVQAIGYDGRAIKGRAVTYVPENSKVCRVDPRGQFWPVERGETTVVAALDDQSIPIRCVVK